MDPSPSIVGCSTALAPPLHFHLVCALSHSLSHFLLLSFYVFFLAHSLPLCVFRGKGYSVPNPHRNTLRLGAQLLHTCPEPVSPTNKCVLDYAAVWSHDQEGSVGDTQAAFGRKRRGEGRGTGTLRPVPREWVW